MRKIDYRFWDKKTKQMHTMTAYEGGRRINTHEEGHMRTTIIKPSVINENNEIFFIEDIILMQYIGRDDDSTGKKIYEGDLVVAIEDVVYIGFVEFKNNSFCITDNSSFTLYNLSDYELHVIGNIYDNENIYNAITDNNVIHDTSASECEREPVDDMCNDKTCRCFTDCHLKCIDPCALCIKYTCEQCKYGYKPLIERLKIKYTEDQLKLYKNCKYVNKLF